VDGSALTFESCRAPVNELDRALGLDGSNGGIDILGDNVSTVHETARHVLSVARVALGHHVGWLEDGAGDLGNRESFMECFLGRDDRGVRGKHEVNTRVRHQVRLELGYINVQGSVETKRRSQGTDDLSNQTIQVGVSGPFNVKVATTHIVQRLVIKAESTVSVLQKSVGRQHRVVGFNDSGRNLGTGRDGERQLGLAAVVNGEALQEQRSKTGTGTSSSGMEDEETLQTGTVVRKLANAVQDRVNNLLSDGVVTTSVVVGSIFLSVDDLLGVVELGVSSATDFVANAWLKINVDGSGDMLSRLGLAKESVEGVIGDTKRLIRIHVTIGGDAVLEAVQLPALVTDLDTGLTQVDGETFCRN
jgi:hypothetical protein